MFWRIFSSQVNSFCLYIYIFSVFCPNHTLLLYPGSSGHGILKARILEWVAILFFKGISPTQVSKLDLLHFRQILYHLRHWGSLLSSTAAAAKLLQSCLTLCDPIDGSPPGSPFPGTPQARILEWVAISSSNA